MKKRDLLLAIEQILGMTSGTLTEDTELASLESWDSLAILEFIAFVDKNYETILSPVDIKKAKTVIELIELVSMEKS